MFTNEQIRTAMGQLVKMKGENHTSFGRYAHPETGEAACFLGALCKMMTGRIPYEGTSAINVLGEGALDGHMQTAFAVAQSLNDQHMEWKYVLKAVDMVLALDEKELLGSRQGCPCGCTSGNGEAINRVMNDIRAIRMLDKGREGKLRQGPLAKGGIVTYADVPKITIKDLSITGITSFSTAMNELTVSLGNISGTLSAYSVAAPVQQKDHALVA